MKKYKLIRPFPIFQDILEIYETNEFGLIQVPNSSVLFNPEQWPDYFKEIKGPVFTSYDGVDYFNENDIVYGVCWKNYQQNETKIDYLIKGPQSGSWYYFSTKEAAEKYIDLNKKQFSKQDIIDKISEFRKEKNIIFSWNNIYKHFGI